MFSLESFHQEYETDISDLAIRDRHFRLFVPKSIDKFLDHKDIFHDFPYGPRYGKPPLYWQTISPGCRSTRKKVFLKSDAVWV